MSGILPERIFVVVVVEYRKVKTKIPLLVN